MSTVQVFQFLLPALNVWSHLPVLRRCLLAQLRKQPTQQAPSSKTAPASQFAQDLWRVVKHASGIESGAAGPVSSSIELLSEPPPQHETLLLRLAEALVEDALTSSQYAHVTRRVTVRAGQVGAEFRLIVEDDGWRERSDLSWSSDTSESRALAARSGGRLRREVDWACDRRAPFMTARASRRSAE